MGFYNGWARLVGLDPDGSSTRGSVQNALENYYSGAAMSERLSKHLKIGPGQSALWATAKGAASAYGWGAASAVLPISPTGPMDMTKPSMFQQYFGGYQDIPKGKDFIGPQKRVKVGSFRNTVYKAGMSLPEGVRSTARGLGHQVAKWFGPVWTAYRLGTEVPGNGVAGGIDRSVRIIGEEMAWTGGAMAGMAIGGTIGSAVPGLGTVVGMAAGFVIGGTAAWGWNRAVDVGEMPIRAVHQGYKFFRDLGIRSRRLELGGSVSAGNMTAAAATMRQRALLEMNRSGINARSLLGKEASMFHVTR